MAEERERALGARPQRGGESVDARLHRAERLHEARLAVVAAGVGGVGRARLAVGVPPHLGQRAKVERGPLRLQRGAAAADIARVGEVLR